MKRLKELLTRPWVVMPLLAVLVLGGWLAWSAMSGDGSAAAVSTGRVVTAELASLAQTVSADGTAAYAQSEDLNFAAAGTVSAVNVSAGDQVKVGQVLAQMTSPDLVSSVAQAEANLASSQAALADDEDAGSSDAQIAADKASVASATDAVAAAEQALAGAQLVASFDGTVSVVDLEVGQQIGAGGASATTSSGTGSGSGIADGGVIDSAGTANSRAGGGIDAGTDSTSDSPQVQVVTPNRFTVQVGLDAADIDSVTVGQKVEVSLSASTSADERPGVRGGGGPPGANGGGLGAGGASDSGASDSEIGANTPASNAQAVSGLVTEVGEVADSSSGVASYPVTVAFDTDSGDYHSGATVLVDITKGDPTEVLQVPAFAVTTEGGTSTVTVQTDDGDEKRAVTTGDSSGAMVEITDGLHEGEQVVLSIPGVPSGRAGTNAADPAGQRPAGGRGSASEDGS